MKRRQGSLNRLALIGIGTIALLLLANAQMGRMLNAQLFQPGLRHYQRGEYTAAEHDFGLYLHFQNEATAHYYLGLCFIKEGRNTDALRQFLLDSHYSRSGRTVYLNERSRRWVEKLSPTL